MLVAKKEDSNGEFPVRKKTFNYYYLLFAPRKTLDSYSIVFNTEAHPLRRASAAAK